MKAESWMITLRAAFAALLGLAGIVENSVHASEFSEIQSENRSAQTLSAMPASEFGDSIDYQNGSFGLVQNDISLTGIGPEIRIDRRFNYVYRFPSGLLTQTLDWVSTGTSADWTLELPRLKVRVPLAQYAHGQLPTGAVLTPRGSWSVAGTNPLARCTNFANPAGIPVRSNGKSWSIPGSEWWTGLSLVIPGHGTQTVLAKDPAATALPTHLVTNDNWMFTCLPTLKNGEAGEGFLAISPSGTKYWLDWLTFTNYDWINTYSNGVSVVLRSVEASMLVTRIEDANGNWVNYTYDDRYLTGITASDGREISLAWTSYNWGGGSYINGQGPFRFVNAITVQPQSETPRVWQYNYALETGGWYWRRDAHLRKVIRPDGSEWTFNLDPLVKGVYSVRSDGSVAVVSYKNLDSTMTSPSGATASYNFSPGSHKRYIAPGGFHDIRYEHQTGHFLAPAKKRVTGPGVDLTWVYTYTPGHNRPENLTPWQLVNTTITNPDQTKTRYTVNNIYRDRLEGRIGKMEVLDAAGVVAREEIYTYADASQSPYPAKVGSSLLAHVGAAGMETYIPLLNRTTIQQGDLYTYRVDNFDVFARTTGQSLYSANHAKTTTTEYYDNPAIWIFGKVQRSSINGTEVQRIEFNDRGLPWRSYRFRKLMQITTYHADGTIATATDGRGNTTTLTTWKRGIPQSVRYPSTTEAPSGAVESLSVNDHGWITAVTNAVGYKTCFGHDPMGRVTSILHPSINVQGECDGSRWRPVSIVHQRVGYDEHGLPAGHWRTSRYEGNQHINVYYDALLRPVLEEVLDASDIGNTLSQTVKRFDDQGRVVFQSYPQRGVGNYQDISAGARTNYDALGRVTRIEQDSEQDVLISVNQYLPGLLVRTTNPRQLSTVTAYMAWDEPSYDLPIASVQPEGKVIEIARHPQLGWPLSLKQRNADSSLQQTRSYVYDQYAQLCKTIDPETGATVMAYDDAGNLAWSASGLVYPKYLSTFQCDTGPATYSGRVVARTYDARNRLETLRFPDGRGDQAWSYLADNKPASVTAWNDVNGGAPVTTAYTYNNRRLLTGESLAQPGWYAWGIGYDYDDVGNLRWQSYPTGLSLDYAPNALGQPTQVKDHAGTVYARGAQYYPNSALKQFTYGNGVVHEMTQNGRQLPSRVRSTFVPPGGKSLSLISDLAYTYDTNGNVTSIWDHARDSGNGQYGRWMAYDGLDRLTDAGSCNFGGDCWHRFTYDALDNLKSWKLGGVKDYAEYVYDANHRLTNIRNTAGSTVVGLSYDDQGNLSNKNGQIYDFDYGNRLRSAVAKEYYRYDGLGRRVLAWEPTSNSILSQYTKNGQVVYEENHRTAIASEHVYLAGSLIATRERPFSTVTPAIKYQHTDALGSPVVVTDTSGQVVERNDYEPWGSVMGKPEHSGIGFTGHVMDGKTGLTYMQQRYYDQSIGRFLSIDPVSASAGSGANFNRYWYANNNPYRLVDPDGRQALDHSAKYLDLHRRHGGNLESMQREMADGTIAGLIITVGVATAFVPDPSDVMLGGLFARYAPRLFGTGRALENLADVWKMDPFARGNAIERHLAKTDYKDWFNVGQLNNGKFPLVDFQKGNKLVSLKSVDTNGKSWMGGMKSHIDDLASSRATVDGKPAEMILDLRVQPGGAAAAKALESYGRDNKVQVIIGEFK
jgi:RHS repeat-associated protein